MERRGTRKGDNEQSRERKERMREREKMKINRIKGKMQREWKKKKVRKKAYKIFTIIWKYERRREWKWRKREMVHEIMRRREKKETGTRAKKEKEYTKKRIHSMA